MSRRLLLLVSALALLLAVAGCTKGDEVATPTRTLPGGTAAPKGTVAPSVAGQPCVAATDVPAAEGKPTVNVPVGPPPTTLQTTDLKPGDGPAAVATDQVQVQYVGIACSTGKQFDSSWDKGAPVTFGLNQVIKGWQEGIVGMKAGGQRQLIIPPDLAYGDSPPPGSGINAGETLIFVVDMIAINPPATTTTTAAGAAK
jgi:peptidylprolyl isomerase